MALGRALNGNMTHWEHRFLDGTFQSYGLYVWIHRSGRLTVRPSAYRNVGGWVKFVPGKP